MAPDNQLQEDMWSGDLLPIPQDLVYAKALLYVRNMLEWMTDGCEMR